MPQLDKLSIFSEVFALFGVFLALFCYISYRILPELALLIKVKTAMSEPKMKDLELLVADLEKDYEATVNDTLDGFYLANLNLVKVLESDKVDEGLRAELDEVVSEYAKIQQ